MQTATVFKSGNSQAVRIPKELQFNVDEVVINKIGDVVMLMPKKSKWASFVTSLDNFTDDFMKDGRNQGEIQERKSL